MKQEKEINNSNKISNKDSFYCRKCMKFLPEKDFYKAVDGLLVDSNGKISVCKTCAQKIYDKLFLETNSMEKTIHKMCTTLNVKFSNEAMNATKLHCQTLLNNGKKVNAIFSIFLMKLVATNPSMDKSLAEDLTYTDVGTIYTEKQIDTKQIPIPQDVITFWGKDLLREEIEFLEEQYTNFKQTHSADTYAEVVLLKQVCYTMLSIKKLRLSGGDTSKLVTELQNLMKNLAISPNAINAKAGEGETESFGLWIQDIEKEEPAQWLSSDPRGDLYHDVGNTEEYFQKYFVRPLKNFITNSKDFNVEEGEKDEDDLALTGDEQVNFEGIDDGVVDEE